MNRAQSKNQQSRAVRAVLERRRNDSVDESAFLGLKDTEDRKNELVSRKLAINGRIGLLNAHIQRADAVVKEGGGKTPARTYGGWKIERANLVVELHDVEAQLVALGQFSRSAREERLRKFDTTFVDVAREMLAAEVFSRIQTATIHRIAERDEAARIMRI